MDDKLRRSVLEKYAKDVKEGLIESSDYISPTDNYLNKALRARNLAEDSLANEVLKQTGVSIPDKGASKSKIENFFSDMLKERYPELENKGIEIRKLADDLGNYDPNTGIIQLNEDMVRKSPIRSTATLLHEGGHKFDSEILKKDAGDGVDNKTLQLLKKKGDLNVNIDPTELYEKLSQGHHLSIPDKREGSFGLGALKSMLKSGTFKGIAPVAAKTALAAGGGLASLASEASDSEETGDAPEQAALLREIDERKRRDASPELAPLYENIDSNSRVSPQDTLKLNALKKLAGK